jgi:VIT1/CCC1 family predicted Fe2+/Mn2+ transporter
MLIKKIDKAKEAFKNKDVEHLKHIHEHHGVEEHNQIGSYVRSAVYGGLDGIITTFAVVSGVAGAQLSAGIVLILGFANLIADGISMGIGDYLSTKSEQEYQASEREREEWEFENYPQGEKDELIEIYERKGYTNKEAKQLVTILSKNKEAFIDTMMVEELDISKNTDNPIKNGAVTFVSFIIFGFIPLFAFVGAKVFDWFATHTFLISIILTGITMFVLGAVKVKVTGRNWFKSGLEMLIVGGIAASAAYAIGALLGGLA